MHYFVISNDLDGNIAATACLIFRTYNVAEHTLTRIASNEISVVEGLAYSYTIVAVSVIPVVRECGIVSALLVCGESGRRLERIQKKELEIKNTQEEENFDSYTHHHTHIEIRVVILFGEHVPFLLFAAGFVLVFSSALVLLLV